jgi:hypothetical protein
MDIDSHDFKFNFFLSHSKKVDSLERGAIENGGATRYSTGIYSNYAHNQYISINEVDNQISIFIPDTINVNHSADNTGIVRYCIEYLNRKYIHGDLTYYNTVGSWYSDTLKQVVYDNIVMITLKKDDLTKEDILNFVDLANYIKVQMAQEGVSISINNSLAIV